MAKTDTTRIDALEAILAEKRKHEGYLAKLEERRGTTPEHVFNRLRDEYLTKLTDLQVRASMESETLHESLRADEQALAEIDARLAAATEERMEGELRAEVGEYDPKEWGARLEALNASIAQIEKDRAAKSASFERTRAMLVEARGAAEVAAAPAAAAPVAPAPVAALPAVAAAPAAPVRASVPTPAAVPPRTSVPTPVAVSPAAPPVRMTPATSVVAPAIAASPAPAPAARPTPMAQPKVEEVAPAAKAPEAPAAVKTPAQGQPMAGSPSFDELAFLNSVVGRASTPVKADGVEGEARASGAVRSVPTPAVAPAPRVSAAVKAPAPPVEEPESALGRPTPRSSQAIKTLKCQECGTLNYPTEWYCERCGGELAAL